MRPVHFELPVEDQARAAAFYAKVFGWDIQQWEGAPYWLATTGPDTEAGINGALGQKSEDFAVPVFVIEVPNIDAAMLMVVEAGATIVHPKRPVPGVGYSAYFEDTEGNRMGLLETDELATIQ